MSDSVTERSESRASSISWLAYQSSRSLFVDESLISKLDKIYYRYASLPEAIQLVTDGAISFSDPRIWPDKYEAYGMAQLFENDGPFVATSIFAKCFSMASSSEAVWRIYGADDTLVRYGLTLRDLLDKLKNLKCGGSRKIYVGEVQYVTPSEVKRKIRQAKRLVPSSASGPVDSLFYKREAFNHEKELRVIVVPKKGSQGAAYLRCTGFEPSRITRLLVDPYIPSWQADVLVDLFQNQLGFSGPVKRSTFDADIST